MKKLIAILLAALACFSLFACGEAAEAVKFEDKLGGSNKKPADTASSSQNAPILRPAETDRVTAMPAQTESPETQKPADTPSAAVSEEQTYSDHLTSGALDQLISDAYLDRGHVEITSYLEDLSGDGIRELLLTVQDTRYAGVRGYAYGTYLFTIANGRVMLIAKEYYGGGSMGGSDLVLVRDTKTGKHHVASSSFFRDGYYFNESLLTPYKFSGYELKTIDRFAAGRATDDDLGSTYVKAIKVETSQYQLKNGELYYWQINDNYVTEDAYNTACSQYQTYDYPEKEGTFSNPLGL